MLLKPESRALRALLWFVIVFVPGGFVILALFAADAVQRRYRGKLSYPATLQAPDTDLSNASLSGAAGTRG